MTPLFTPLPPSPLSPVQAECGWNAGWVKDCFGEEGLKKVGREVISCSGTSMATWQDGLAYARLMAAEIGVNTCERNGVDQGMHNYFLYSGNLTSIVTNLYVATCEEGPVASIQSMPRLVRDKAGRLLNNDRTPYAVVHQYDRSEMLTSQYSGQYPWLAGEE